MNRKYFCDEELLPKDSWMWFSLNDTKKPQEPHHLLIALEKIDQPDGSIRYYLKKFTEILLETEGLYQDIYLEQVSFHRGCGDYDHQWYLVGKRLETDSELKQRLDFEAQEVEKGRLAEEEKIKQQEEKEYKQLLKLQEKFKNKKE